MFKMNLASLVIAAQLIAVAAPSLAYNESKHLGARQQVLVTKVLSDAHSKAGEDKSAAARLQAAQCNDGSLNIGNVILPERGRAPEEVNVIITGDVVNAGGGRARGCR